MQCSIPALLFADFVLMNLATPPLVISGRPSILVNSCLFIVSPNPSWPASFFPQPQTPPSQSTMTKKVCLSTTQMQEPLLVEYSALSQQYSLAECLLVQAGHTHCSHK